MKLRRKALFVILIVLFCVSILEIGFRILLNLTGKDVITVLPAKEVLEKAWFNPHPHLLYVFKPNSSFTMNAYGRHNFTINEYGFRSTSTYDVKDIAKPPNTLRVVTFGGSTTMGVNDDDEIWPYFIGKFLSESFQNKNIEVLNAGLMGYNSLDNLIDLALRAIDFDCDVYVIYLGVNDLSPRAPLNIYKTDNSHFRRTLYESLYSSPAQLLPSVLLRLKIFRAFLELSGVPDSRNLIRNTSTAQFRKCFKIKDENISAIEIKMRQTTIRNVKSMVGIIRVHRPDAMIVLSSFYDLENQRFLNDLNDDFRKLSSQLNLVFVDAANEIPKEQSMAYDYGHFTPEGDRRMGKLFASVITKNLASKDLERDILPVMLLK